MIIVNTGNETIQESYFLFGFAWRFKRMRKQVFLQRCSCRSVMVLSAMILVFLCSGCDDNAAAVKEADAFIESARKWDPVFDTDKTIKLTLSNQRWFPIGQGCEFFVNGKPFILRRDLASMLVDIDVQNLTEEPLQFYPEFHMEYLGSDGRMIVTTGEEEPVDYAVTIQPKETVVFTLQTVHKGIDEYNQEPALLLTGHQNENSWEWPLSNIPGHDALFGKFYSCIHLLQVEISDQQWAGVSAGSRAEVSSEESITITDDLAGLELTVKATNPTEYPLNITDFPLLVSSKDGIVDEYFPAIGQEGMIDDVVVIEPGDTRSFEMQMSMKSYQEMTAMAPFVIQWDDFKITLPASDIPAKAHLYAK